MTLFTVPRVSASHSFTTVLPALPVTAMTFPLKALLRQLARLCSAGKTVVKEWLAETLGTVKSVIRSPRSYNSQVGVALSLMNIDNRFDVAVIEAGISRPGEMERLARIIRPDTVIITNIGDAHGESFTGREAIATEKLLSL